MMYDSGPETRRHIGRVRALLGDAAGELLWRGRLHDRSKLEPPEKEAFDRVTPLLEQTTYGSSAYRELLDEIRPALDHHYEANASHHPEGNPDGIHGMSLMDLTELLCDWKAASERGNGGDIGRSIELNADRFGYGPELETLLRNQAQAWGWL